MTTVNTGNAPYCTPQQMVARYDVRTLGDLLNDEDQRLTPASVLGSTILGELLSEASGWVESACFTADRYAAADLAAVAASGNGSQFLAGMVAGITMWMCFDRRPEKASKYELPAKAQLAMEMLDRLRLGERILPIQEAGDAGLPQSFVLTPPQVFTQNYATTQAGRYFGQRDNQTYPPQY